MSKSKAVKGALSGIAELLPIERGMLGPTYSWLMKFLGKAPRDEVGRIPLEAVSKAELEALMDLSPKSPGGLVFHGQPVGAKENPSLFVAKWPRHAMGYAAGDVGTSKRPTGFLSVYEAPWEALPEYGADHGDPLARQILSTANQLNRGEGRTVLDLPQAVRDAGGARLLNIQDWALGPRGKFDDNFQHSFPQAVIVDKAKLQRKARGGLVQMRGA